MDKKNKNKKFFVQFVNKVSNGYLKYVKLKRLPLIFNYKKNKIKRHSLHKSQTASRMK